MKITAYQPKPKFSKLKKGDLIKLRNYRDHDEDYKIVEIDRDRKRISVKGIFGYFSVGVFHVNANG